jgi:hypothetical protein
MILAEAWRRASPKSVRWGREIQLANQNKASFTIPASDLSVFELPIKKPVAPLAQHTHEDNVEMLADDFHE